MKSFSAENIISLQHFQRLTYRDMVLRKNGLKIIVQSALLMIQRILGFNNASFRSFKLHRWLLRFLKFLNLPFLDKLCKRILGWFFCIYFCQTQQATNCCWFNFLFYNKVCGFGFSLYRLKLLHQLLFFNWFLE